MGCGLGIKEFVWETMGRKGKDGSWSDDEWVGVKGKRIGLGRVEMYVLFLRTARGSFSAGGLRGDGALGMVVGRLIGQGIVGRRMEE
jgi:hypothetical protein